MSPIPIVVCGKHTVIATTVRDGLSPEYDVIHIVQSVEAAVEEIPLVLSGSKPPSASTNLGSRNYGSQPVAVAIGGGFDDEMFAAIKEACKDSKVVWLRPDRARMADMPPLDQHERFGAATAVRVKECLKLHRVGEGGEKEGEVLF